MKIKKSEFKQTVIEELTKVLNDSKMYRKDDKLKRWKVYIQGEKKPLILTGKDARSVKKYAHQMINNNSVKIKKVVKEGINEAGSIGGALNMSSMEDSYTVPKRNTEKGGPTKFLQKFSSKEARNIIDGQLKNMVKDLRKVQGRVIKTWMDGAKSGQIDFFDIIRGLKTGDVRRAHSEEIDFLVNVLTRDKVINRFRSYFNGKKGKKERTK